MFETAGEYWVSGVFIVVCIVMLWLMYKDTHDDPRSGG